MNLPEPEKQMLKRLCTLVERVHLAFLEDLEGQSGNSMESFLMLDMSNDQVKPLIVEVRDLRDNPHKLAHVSAIAINVMILLLDQALTRGDLKTPEEIQAGQGLFGALVTVQQLINSTSMN